MTTTQKKYRVYYTAVKEHAGKFMSAPMTKEEVETTAAKMKLDPNITNIEIKLEEEKK